MVESWERLYQGRPVNVAVPTNGTFTTATTGGTLAPGTYAYRVTATTANGETLPSTESTIVVPSGTSTNTVTVTWAVITGATGYKVYGRTSGSELRLATISGGSTVSYTDTGSGTPSGAMPTLDTSGEYPLYIASGKTLLKQIKVCNLTGSTVTAYCSIVPIGGIVDDSHRIFGQDITNKNTLIFNTLDILNPGDTLRGYATGLAVWHITGVKNVL
jgi:hypothetical protein